MRRSMLFLPANSPNMVVNGGVLGADSLIFDLEDAVSPDEKDAARDLLRSALEALERITHEASSIAVISGYDSECDGSLEERAEEKKTLFHFEQGPLTVTVTKDEPAQREEIDLSDVEVYDQDPTLSVETASVQPAAEAGPEIQPAEPDENDGLPFEG